jgi:hypothetical protein
MTMARKPRKQWSKAYAKRIARAEAKGLSRQAARGHKQREHISRKEAKGLTAGQSAAVNNFARKQAKRAGGDQDEAAHRLKAWTREQGYQRFQELKANVAGLEKGKRERETVHVERGGKRATLHISTGGQIGAMQSDAEDFDLPDMPDGDELGWFYYH